MRPHRETAMLQGGAVANGDGTPMDVAGLTFVCLQATGITTATINWEATVDGVNWVAVLATNQTTGAVATTTTTNGLFGMNCAGYASVRARISGYAAGTIVVTGLAMAGG